MLALALFYLDLEAKLIASVRYAFMLLTPFGWSSFFGWVIAFGISLWAAHALGWNDPVLRRVAKVGAVSSSGILLVHAAWVLFVVFRGGL
jgi:hypothetical protein